MSMHKQKFVACIKAAGKILRESKDTVKLPFGAEYSVYLKNLNSVRASVRVEIDGKDVLDGTSLVINANSELNLERFIKNGNFNKGNKFKFIERNSKVEAARGIGGEDGLIRIEFQFEKDPIKEYKEYYEKYVKKEYVPVPYPVYPRGWPHYPYDWWYWNGYPYSGGGCFGSGFSSGSASYTNTHLNASNNAVDNTVYQMNTTLGGESSGFADTVACNATFTATSGEPSIIRSKSASFEKVSLQADPNDAGITVAGGVSDQQFQSVAHFALEDEKHVIVLKLLGRTEKDEVVAKPVTVNTKQKCSTCNRVNKAKHKFCVDCGTALEIV